MAIYPDINPGDKWSQSGTAEQWQQAMRDLERIAKALDLRSSPLREAFLPFKDVVILNDPSDTDLALTVREVRYIFPVQRCLPNEPICQYTWNGPEFEAYPSLGHSAIDYQNFVWNETTIDGEPVLPNRQATFLRVEKLYGDWILQKPPGTEGGSIRVAIVKSAITSASSITVQEVKLIDVQGGVPVYAPIGNEFLVLTIPGSRGVHFQQHLASAQVPGLFQPVLIITTPDGTEYATQEMRCAVRGEITGILKATCLPPGTTVAGAEQIPPTGGGQNN